MPNYSVCKSPYIVFTLLPFLMSTSTYTALETLTEPHQVIATLQCLTAVSRSLLSGGNGR